MPGRRHPAAWCSSACRSVRVPIRPSAAATPSSSFSPGTSSAAIRPATPTRNCWPRKNRNSTWRPPSRFPARRYRRAWVGSASAGSARRWRCSTCASASGCATRNPSAPPPSTPIAATRRSDGSIRQFELGRHIAAVSVRRGVRPAALGQFAHLHHRWRPHRQYRPLPAAETPVQIHHRDRCRGRSGHEFRRFRGCAAIRAHRRGRADLARLVAGADRRLGALGRSHQAGAARFGGTQAAFRGRPHHLRGRRGGHPALHQGDGDGRRTRLRARLRAPLSEFPARSDQRPVLFRRTDGSLSCSGLPRDAPRPGPGTAPSSSLQRQKLRRQRKAVQPPKQWQRPCRSRRPANRPTPA